MTGTDRRSAATDTDGRYDLGSIALESRATQVPPHSTEVDEKKPRLSVTLNLPLTT